MRMLRFLLLTGVVFWAGTSVAGANDKAPDVSFMDAHGQPVRLSNWVGKEPLVLLFMRGFVGDFSCTFCGMQTKQYEGSYDKLRAAGAEVLMILPGVKDPKDVAAYLESIGAADEPHPNPAFSVRFPLLLDPDLSACHAFAVSAENRGEGAFPVNEPATIVIGKDGSILYAYHGQLPGDRPSVEAVLDVVRNGKAPTDALVHEAPKKSSESLPSLNWVPFVDGMKTARESKKPILLEFFADW
ncbi:MAG: redoxin domain-containing protein [Planctomycetes bacterium]|nr:redoxin domain-containing protein [Planctomycetota bacterium]MBI3843207.1 redoxin domain-containing protein [Planctomycetota bacterium]